jgi:hypothetical protein
MNADSLRRTVRRSALVAVALALAAIPSAQAQGGCDNDCAGPDVPEISSVDLSPVAPTAALLGGCVLVLNERRRKATAPNGKP